MRAKALDSYPYSFSYRWLRGPRRPLCAHTTCPRRESCDPLQWSRASKGGPSLQCAVCERNRVPRYNSLFCSVGCFKVAWKEHSQTHTALKDLSRDRGASSSISSSSESLSSSVTSPSSTSNPPMQPVTRIEDEDDIISSSTLVNAEKDDSEWICVYNDQNYQPTEADVGCVLLVEVTAISNANGKPLTAPVLVYTEPVLGPPTPPPKRQLLTVPGAHSSAGGARFRVISYNILAELYATKQAYPYCDPWSLLWPYRKSVLQKELEEAQADVVCLQEVQTDHYELDINPFMQDMGYDGIYKQKSRESMGQYGKVDGCATFWKKNKFMMTENYTIEFNECARRAASEMGLDDSEYRRYMNRLSRDNIAQIVVLDTLSRSRQSSLMCIANTHLYSNHQCPDVKLWQTMTLMRELDQFVHSRDVSLILCGDFNSEPESAVYEFLGDGVIERSHPELDIAQERVQILPELHNIVHNIELASAMETALGGEPYFTNYTATFKGCLDYIWYTPSRLRVLAVYNIPDERSFEIQGLEGLPAVNYPSDHLLLCCDFMVIGGGGLLRNGRDRKLRR